jgi:hypothetical protein
VSRNVSYEIRKLVVRRAGYRCEYCLTDLSDKTAETDHVIPVSKSSWIDGSSEVLNDDSNLACACPRCNRNKGDTEKAHDPITDQIYPLFTPRNPPYGIRPEEYDDYWHKHFDKTTLFPFIIGKTPIGRATATVLFRKTDAHLLRYPWDELQNGIDSTTLKNFLQENYTDLKIVPKGFNSESLNNWALMSNLATADVREAYVRVSKEEQRRFIYLSVLLQIKECHFRSTKAHVVRVFPLLRKLRSMALQAKHEKEKLRELAQYHLMAEIAYQQWATLLVFQNLKHSEMLCARAVDLQIIRQIQASAAHHFAMYVNLCRELKLYNQPERNLQMWAARGHAIHKRYSDDSEYALNSKAQSFIFDTLPHITADTHGHVELTYAADVLLATKFSGKSIEKLLSLMGTVLSQFGYGQGFENDTLLPLFRRYMGLSSKLGLERNSTEVGAFIKLAEGLGMNNERRTLFTQLHESNLGS